MLQVVVLSSWKLWQSLGLVVRAILELLVSVTKNCLLLKEAMHVHDTLTWTSMSCKFHVHFMHVVKWSFCQVTEHTLQNDELEQRFRERAKDFDTIQAGLKRIEEFRKTKAKMEQELRRVRTYGLWGPTSPCYRWECVHRGISVCSPDERRHVARWKKTPGEPGQSGDQVLHPKGILKSISAIPKVKSRMSRDRRDRGGDVGVLGTENRALIVCTKPIRCLRLSAGAPWEGGWAEAGPAEWASPRWGRAVSLFTVLSRPEWRESLWCFDWEKCVLC